MSRKVWLIIEAHGLHVGVTGLVIGDGKLRNMQCVSQVQLCS